MVARLERIPAEILRVLIVSTTIWIIHLTPGEWQLFLLSLFWGFPLQTRRARMWNGQQADFSYFHHSRNEFTPGQEERLFTLWDDFRQGR